jgi:hypothetical protein
MGEAFLKPDVSAQRKRGGKLQNELEDFVANCRVSHSLESERTRTAAAFNAWDSSPVADEGY